MGNQDWWRIRGDSLEELQRNLPNMSTKADLQVTPGTERLDHKEMVDKDRLVQPAWEVAL